MLHGQHWHRPGWWVQLVLKPSSTHVCGIPLRRNGLGLDKTLRGEAIAVSTELPYTSGAREVVVCRLGGCTPGAASLVG